MEAEAGIEAEVGDSVVTDRRDVGRVEARARGGKGISKSDEDAACCAPVLTCSILLGWVDGALPFACPAAVGGSGAGIEEEGGGDERCREVKAVRETIAVA